MALDATYAEVTGYFGEGFLVRVHDIEDSMGGKETCLDQNLIYCIDLYRYFRFA